MAFSSVTFIFVFLPLVLSGYFLVNSRWRNTLLLLSSLLFYAWGEGVYVLALIVSIFVTYSFSRYIQKGKDKDNVQLCRRLLAASIVFNLALLFIFKYANFALDVAPFLSWVGIPWVRETSIHLPLGISFFTFQAISYRLDVYRDDVKASQNLAGFVVYRSLFPVLIAGPIVRYKDVAAQMTGRVITSESIAEGIQRFVIGLGKKVLIANTLADVADDIFSLRGDEISLLVLPGWE